MSKLQFEKTSKVKEADQLVKELVVSLAEFRAAFNSLAPFGQSIKTDQDLITALTNPVAHHRAVVKAQIPDEEFSILVDKEARLKSLTLPDVSHLIEMSAAIRSKNYLGLEIGLLFHVEGTNSIKVNEKAKQEYYDKTLRLFSQDGTQAKFIEKHKAFVEAYADFKNFANDYFGENNMDQFFNLKEFKIEKFINVHSGELETGLKDVVFANQSLWVGKKR